MLNHPGEYKTIFQNGLFLLLISQGIFWLLLALAESKGRPDALPEPSSLTMFFADEDGNRLEGFDPVDVPLVAEPGYVYIDDDRHPRALFVHTFDLGDRSLEHGILLGWARRVVDVRINDWPLKTQAPIDIWGILGGHDPVVYSFPDEYLLEGTNTLEVLVSGRSRKIMPYLFIGELGEMYAANTWLRMFSVDLVVVSTGVLLFAILLNLLIHWPARDKIRIRSLNLLLAAWTLRNVTFLGIDGGLPDPFRLLFHFVVTYIFLFALLAFALGWTRRPIKAFYWVAAAFGVCVLIASVATAISDVTLFSWAFAVETIVTLMVGAIALYLFAEYWTSNGRQETTELLLFLVCVGAVVADAIDDRWQIAVPFADIPLTFYAAPMCGLLLALGMVASLAAQSTRARVATENVNELLRSKLQQQEERLTVAHEREKLLAEQKTLVDERQRIIRDMHDGVGGSLMSLLLRARRKELSDESLVRSLNSSMNDLRLIIDSFDHVGDNLEFALSIFKQRVEPELHSSGVTLHYKTNAASAIEGFGPEPVLQIYRILQEACNNAVNHGDAKNIFIELTTDFESREVTITVADDGSGFDVEKITHGRGLSNLEHRARSLGGTLSIARNADSPGMCVALTFPMR